MANRNKIRFYFILFTTILLNGFYAKGQNLIDKQIFVSSRATIQIIFNAKIDKVVFDEPDPYPVYKFSKNRGHDNLLSLDATKNIGPKNLTIIEGRRTHKFIVTYKDEIEESELYYDFSNMANLAKEARALEAANAQKQPPPVAINQEQPKTQPPPASTTTTSDNKKLNSNFYDYLQQADDALANNYFNDAEEAYAKAQKLKPNDEKLKAERKLIDDKKNALYADVMAKAGAAYNNRKYDEATELYNQAMSIKKDEPLPKLMLKNTQDAKDAESKRLVDQKMNEQYTKAMSDASDAYKQGAYEKAVILYTDVLKIAGHENDVTVKSWITLSNGKIEEKKKLGEKQKNDETYNGFTKSAEEEYSKGAFDNAILLYKEAMKVPGHERDFNATSRITAINKKIEDSNRESAKKKIDDEYKSFIKAGDDAFAIGQFEQAKASYNEALKMRNGSDADALLKIKKTNDKIADNEREEKLAKIKRDAADAYAAAVASADKAYASSDYNAARTGYEKAAKMGDATYPNEQIRKINENLLAENARQAALKKQADDRKRYDDLVTKADNALLTKDYPTAEIFYNQALAINPNERYPKDKLVAIKSTKEKIDDQYKKAMKAGDDNLNIGQFERAKTSYNEALTIRGGIDADASAKIKKTNDKIADKEQEERLAKIRKDAADAYLTAIGSADKAFAGGDYNAAKAGYEKAATLGDTKYPNEQIKKINEIKIAALTQQAILKKEADDKKRLDDIVVKADNALLAKDFSNAETLYRQALTIRPNEQYPKDKIAEIKTTKDKLIADKKARDEQILAEQKAREAQALADKKAKDEQALAEKKVKDEQASRDKAEQKAKEEKALAEKKVKDEQALAEKKARDEQAKEEEKQNQLYRSALAKARAAYIKKDLAAAMMAYKAAYDIKPNEPEPMAKIVEIDNKIKEIARQKEVDNRYDSLKAIGNSAMQRGLGGKDFTLKQMALDTAIAAFEQAVALKQTGDYVKKQIDFLKNEKENNIQKKVADDDLAAVKERLKVYSDASEKAKLALQSANNANTRVAWENALAAFNEVLKVKPTDSYSLDRVKAIQAAMDRLPPSEAPKRNQPVTPPKKRKRDQNNTPVVDVPKDTTPAMVAVVQPTPEKKIIPDVQISQEMVVQASAIPYPEDVLQNKYPTIDFNQPPREQTYNGVGNNSLNYPISNSLLAEKPRLKLSDSVNFVKLTLEALSFKGTNVYIKLLVQNHNSYNPFLVGPMMLTWSKKDGSVSKLLPGYITSFPVVMPNNLYELVYVARNVNVSADEYLFFEMSDRLKKSKLKVAVSGQVYKSEKDR